MEDLYLPKKQYKLVKIITKNLDKNDFKDFKQKYGKVDWKSLSQNKSTIQLLEHNEDKINWNLLYQLILRDYK